MAAAPARRVAMAAIGAPHGVRGDARLTVFAQDPLALRRYNPFETDDGRTLTLTAVRRLGKGLVAAFAGVEDRDAAATLRGQTLWIPRARLPAPAADEFYHVDLVGLEARLADGGVLGIVRAVSDFGAGDILEVRGSETVLVPFTRAVVPHVAVGEGYLVVDPPPGLLDEPPEVAPRPTSPRPAGGAR